MVRAHVERRGSDWEPQNAHPGRDSKFRKVRFNFDCSKPQYNSNTGWVTPILQYWPVRRFSADEGVRRSFCPRLPFVLGPSRPPLLVAVVLRGDRGTETTGKRKERGRKGTARSVSALNAPPGHVKMYLVASRDRVDRVICLLCQAKHADEPVRYVVA
jgi:hypothetical protein